MVLPAPGVATAMKSRGLVSKYFCIASACQARRLTEVPQGARSGYAGESFGFTILSNSVGSSTGALILSFFLVYSTDSSRRLSAGALLPRVEVVGALVFLVLWCS